METDEDKFNARLCKQLSYKLYTDQMGYSREDLEQQGLLALWECRDRIPEDPMHAIAYRRLRAKGAMLDYMRRQSWVPRDQYDNAESGYMVSLDGMQAQGEGVNVERFQQQTSDNASSRLDLRDAEIALQKICSRGLHHMRIVQGLLKGQTSAELAIEIGCSQSRVCQIIREITTVYDRRQA